MKRTPLERRTPLKQGSGLARTASKPKRSGFTPASKEQRAKVKGHCCVVCGRTERETVIDPAHLCARTQGGCETEWCVVPLCRRCHGLFDTGQLDIQPYLVMAYPAEIAHAVEHYNGDLIALLQRLTGCRWGPLEGGEGL